MMISVGIIPARMKSLRFPGKPLVNLFGKPMIYYVWRQAKKSKDLNEVYIATDSKQIKNEAEKFGAKVIITSSKHKTGTDRIAEAAKKINADIIVNIQGDEPLINPNEISKTVKYMLKNKDVYFLTLAKKFLNHEHPENNNVNKVVIDKKGDALYFSRSKIPFERKKFVSVYKHIGFYVYRKDFLLKFTNLKQTPLEKTECLEQLRALENGYKLRVLLTKYDSIGVDTPEDLEIVKKLMEK